MIPVIKKFKGSWFWLIFWIIIFFPVAIGYYLKKYDSNSWFNQHYILSTILIFLILAIINSFFADTNTSQTIEDSKNINLPVEISLDELLLTFGEGSELTNIQKEDLYKTKYKDKIIQTSLIVDEVDKATLSSQYVVKELFAPPYDYSCVAKAFFPNVEKEQLLKANLGDTLIFTGKLVNYNFGVTSCIEFTDAKVIEIKEGY